MKAFKYVRWMGGRGEAAKLMKAGTPTPIPGHEGLWLIVEIEVETDHLGVKAEPWSERRPTLGPVRLDPTKGVYRAGFR